VRRRRSPTPIARRSPRTRETTSSASDTTAALAAIEEIVAESGDADDVLRRVVTALHEQAGYPWAGIELVENGELVLGPNAGTATTAATRTRVPVTYQGERVAELVIDDASEENRRFLERVADLVALHCLVGWDTGGESWEP
jgi:hypothetical protein